MCKIELRMRTGDPGTVRGALSWADVSFRVYPKPTVDALQQFPDELNHFFARFDKGVIHHTRNADSSMVVHPISLSTTEVHSALSRVDPHDTTVVGRISKNDDSAYREEIQSLSAWCSMNNLTLNATKSKELIVDFLKSNSSRHSPIYINGSEVE
ncbi:hypothetical protein QTP86_005293 [Hemibagrus guttatus]|nr:hypothetical protein QTP86_005293 [Hemibagrus guttatus]